jgi:hypothetical protein
MEPARVNARAAPRRRRPGRVDEPERQAVDERILCAHYGEPELFGLFSRSHVSPIRQFADGIAHTLRRCRADISEPDLANIADILLRVALGIIVFPTDRLDTSDPAAVRDYAARYLVPIIGQTGR